MTATRKGINAVGATNDTLKEWDAWRDKQLSLLPPAARQRGKILLTAQRVQMERTSFVYEQGSATVRCRKHTTHRITPVSREKACITATKSVPSLRLVPVIRALMNMVERRDGPKKK
jgi:hypothetical protein